METVIILPTRPATSTNKHLTFTATPPTPPTPPPRFIPTPPRTSTSATHPPIPSHDPHLSLPPTSASPPDPPTSRPPLLCPSPHRLLHHPSRPRCRPQRLATTTAHYNLSAKWSSLSGYLTSSSSSGGSSDDSSTSTHNSHITRSKRLRDEDGSEDSDSNEYVSGGPGGKRGLSKKELGKGGGVGREKRRRRGERLERADMEVILGEKGRGKVRRVGREGLGLGGLTRGEAGRLVEFLLGGTDWEGAVGFMRGEGAGEGGVGEVRATGGMERPVVGEGKATKRVLMPEGLKTHWREVLGKKLVELYRE